MKIDNRTWIILAIMVLCALYIGWLHMVIRDYEKRLGDTIVVDIKSTVPWPPVDARTDRKLPITILERND